MRNHTLLLCLLPAIAALIAMALGGCGGTFIPSYTGGGLPPGDPDIGGQVLYEVADEADGTQATEPVVGAEVVLYRGQNEVGRTLTGAGGFFRFQNPDTGNYRVRVTPPAGSGLRQAERQFRHRHGQQTYLTIVLEAL